MKPKLRQTLPKPIAGNNQYPGELAQVLDYEGKSMFVPVTEIHDFRLVDYCVVIDTHLGIFAREQACDTIYLKRDHTKPGLVFREP